MDEVTVDLLKESFGAETEFDEAKLTPFLEIVNGATSRAELAQKLIEFNTQSQQAAADELVSQFNNTIETWQAEAKAHPKLGGENLAPTLDKIKSTIETYAEKPAEVYQLLKHTGAGNSVHLIQLLHAMADKIPGEARPAEGAPASSEKSLADRLFSNKPN